MAEITRIWSFQFVRLCRPNEAEGVATDLHVVDGLGDLGHVAGDALTARASGRMMCMLLDGCCVRPILRIRTVASQAEPVSCFAHHAGVIRAVWVVATETGNAASVHQASDEIIALHSVLVCAAVSEMSKRGFSELVIFQSPEVRKIEADVEADWPIVVFSLDWVSERPSLGMTLDAGIAGMDVVEAGRVEDGVTDRPGHMRAARAVALFAANIPLSHGLGRNIIIHRMAAVAERAGRPLEIVRRVKRSPPVSVVGDEIALPHLVRDVPLRGLRKIIVADLGEIALLPAAAVDERDIVLRERQRGIRLGHVRNEGVRMLVRITYDIGHARLPPAIIDFPVTGLAGG